MNTKRFEYEKGDMEVRGGRAYPEGRTGGINGLKREGEDRGGIGG
jgi:hypothetical protein